MRDLNAKVRRKIRGLSEGIVTQNSRCNMTSLGLATALKSLPKT